MIRLVSCGIGNARDKENIPCACKDAELIYDSFQRHFPDFDNCYSITLSNDVTSDEFTKTVKNAAKGLEDPDVLVVYFSGHAVDYEGEGIKLLFYNGKNDAFFSNHLLEVTSFSKCSKLLILDCCHAGGAAPLANYEPLRHEKFFVLAATSEICPTEFGALTSPFTHCLVNSLDKLDSTNQEISLLSISQTLKDNGYTQSKVAIAVGNEDLILKDAVSTTGNTEFLAAFWSKLSTLPSSMRAIMWYALDSSNLGYDIKIKTIEQLCSTRPHFYEGSWIVRRAIGHMLGELPQQELRVQKAEEELLNSSNWMDICIGLVATRNQNTPEMQNKRRDICNCPERPMDVVWLANLYYADHFTESRGDEIFFPKQLCETAWGVEDLFARYKEHAAVLDRLEEQVGGRFHDILQTQKLMLEPDTYSTTNQLLRTYLKCPKRGRTVASYRDKWLRSVLFGQWRDHPMADNKLEVYFQSTNQETIQKDLKQLRSVTVNIKLSILSYVSSLSFDIRKQYQDALGWALKDPHPWVRRESFMIFSDDLKRIKEDAFCDIVNREQYPGVLDMIIEANAISKRPDWNLEIKEYCKKNKFSKAETKAIESYLE